MVASEPLVEARPDVVRRMAGYEARRGTSHDKGKTFHYTACWS